MFRRRKAVESERSPTSSSSKQRDTNEEGLWYRKPPSGSSSRFGSGATNAATASPLHLVSSEQRNSNTPPPAAAAAAAGKNRDYQYRNNYSHQRGQDDDDESTQRPSDSVKRAYEESKAASPTTANMVAKHMSPASTKGSTLKGGDLIALIVCEEWDQAIKALDDNPKVARMPQKMTLDGHDSQGLPLHLTVCSRPSFKFVEKLLLAFPDATKTPDEVTGRLPLHWACICRASVAILKLLLDHYPVALASLDTLDGRLPLHYACLYGSPDVVELIVSLEKRAVVYKDNSGVTPYDLIQKAHNNPFRDAILNLLENAKNDLDKSKQKRYRDREHQTANNSNDNHPSTPRKLPPIPVKDAPTPNMSNASTRQIIKSDASANSEWENPNSVDLASEPRSSPNNNQSYRKRSSLRNLFGRGGGTGVSSGNSITKPPPHTLPTPSSQPPVILSPHDQSFATGQAVAGSPWSNRPNHSGSAPYHNSSMATSLQRSVSQFSQQSVNDRRHGATDMGHSAIPEPPLVRGRSAFEVTKQATAAGTLSNSLPPYHQYRSGGTDAQSTASSVARSEVFSSYAHELSFHKQKLSEKDSELMSLDAQVRMLDLRRQVLLEECHNAETSVLEKQNIVEKRQKTISRLKSQLLQLQAELEAEESALELAESTLIVHRETLGEHEQKIRAAEDEKHSLTAIRESVMDQKREIHRNVSNIEAEIKSLESMHERIM